MTLADELKPCPFCGGKDVDEAGPSLGCSRWRIVCDDCGAEGPPHGTEQSTEYHPSEAISAWNTRASEARDVLREVLGAHIQADAYAQEIPEDEQDALYLRKQETWWRLTARAWMELEDIRPCAEMAKKRVGDSPEWQAELDKARAALKGADDA